MGGREAADRSNDYPVVGKIYSATHASAMVLRELTVNGVQLLFNESLVKVYSDWDGFWLSDLLDLRPQLKAFFSVRVVAALSTAEVLQRQHLDLPFYVDQYGVPQQYGVKKNKENSDETETETDTANSQGGFGCTNWKIDRVDQNSTRREEHGNIPVGASSFLLSCM